MDRPFLGTEALRAGLTRRALASRHDSIYRNVYFSRDAEMTASTRAVAAWLWSGRQATMLMDGGAESPQETRTRLVLLDAGLPKPRTQIVVPGNFLGRKHARIDMGYQEFNVGVEYEGAQHWTDPAVRTNDIDRYAELAAQGWIIIRVSSDMLRYRPHVIVARTCEALRSRDAQWPVIARMSGDRVA